MSETLLELKKNLGFAAAQVKAKVPSGDAIAKAHNNGSFPYIDKEELIEETQDLIYFIDQNIENFDLENEENSEEVERLEGYIERIKLLGSQGAPTIWQSPGQSIASYILTLRGLRRALSAVLFSAEDPKETTTKLRALNAQIRGLEASLSELKPRTASLTSMVASIEDAHNAAFQLPTDLASLREARGKIEELTRAATKDQSHIEELRGKADQDDIKLSGYAESANEVLKKCDAAYSAATSQGLALAFSERSKSLSESMWIWVFGLITALALGSIFGSAQLKNLSELFKQPDLTISLVILNVALSLLSIGAPVWFGWLATKQIGQRFRLAEDYAFKASISRAYEGFRKEAARLDPMMEKKLLDSALTRLDELPLRLVESETHGSPWHELASSSFIKDAMRMVPDFTTKVKNLAEESLMSIRTKETASKNIKPEKELE